MTASFEWKMVAASVALALGLAVPALAQSDNVSSADQSMKAAGESMENAGSDVAKGAEHAYHGTATAVRDTKITAKVKAALHEDSATEHSDIDVSTTAGVVTLKGKVDSMDAATYAGKLALKTEGVKDVRNELEVAGSSMPD